MKCVLYLSVFLLALNSALASILTEEVKNYENFQVLRVKTESRNDIETLYGLNGVHFWNEGRIGGHADIMFQPSLLDNAKNELKKLGFEFSVMVDNVGELMRLEKVPTSNDREIINTKHAMTWTEYHSQDDMEGFLDYLAETYDFVEVESIGESYEGRPMRVLKVCKGGCGNKPAMWIDGGIHAREWISPASVTWLMQELVENDSEHSDLTDNLDWYILPIVNPDGYAWTRSNDRLWRKTRTPNSLGICKGTDANRNWGFMWNTGGSSNQGCSDTYHGPEAFSEVENRNIRDFVTKNKDQIKFFNTIHSYSQLILIPYGHTSEPCPGFDDIKALADKANEALYAVHQKSYDVGCIPCLLYVASGGSMDYALGELGIKYSIAMELRDTGRYGFVLPPEQIVPTAEEFWAFHAKAAELIMAEFS